MRDLEPEPAEDEPLGVFDVEISPLGAEDADQQASGLSALPDRPLSRRARAWRVVAVGSVFLALVLVLENIPSLRAQVQTMLTTLFPATQPAPVTQHDPFSAPVARAGNWALLEDRPLRLPTLAPGAPCPATHGAFVNQNIGIAVGQPPVYALYNVGSSAEGVLRYSTSATFGAAPSAWGGQSVLWVIRPEALGPVLVRGRQVDGPNALRFNGGIDQQGYIGSWSAAPLLPELRLLGSYDTVSWFYWGSFMRLSAPGCYAYQVDGLTFSYVFIFQAVMESWPG
jgi:hypothetical protein